MRLFNKEKYWDVYPRRGKELLRTNPELFELNEEDTLEDSNLADYDAEESTTAAYVMGTLRSGPHTVIAGLRFEQNEWESVNKRASYLDGRTTINTVNNGNSFDHWLPGIHFRHELKRNLILRESYNRSYGRPRLSQLTRGRFTNEDGDIVEGNPALSPATADNFDVQLEFYTQNGGLYSAGFFYKKVKNFSYDAVYEFDALDANGVPIRVASGDFEYERPENGSTGKNYGLELIARQRLTFIPDPFKGFSVALSATFTESEATIPNRTDRDDLTLPGFSPYLFTSTLEYARGNFRGRIDYRYRDDYIEGLGDDIESDEYFAGEERVDAEVSYRLRRGLSLYANVTNFTKRPQVSYQGFPQFVEDSAFAGRKWTFGVEYSF
jgi:TonB-dependent receptor